MNAKLMTHYKIDPRFGTNELFKELGLKAKEMNIKLVMDMIPNHCGSFHWFFIDPPMKNWFNNQSEFKQTTHRSFSSKTSGTSLYQQINCHI